MTLLEENMILLGENWKKIQNKVVFPLWNGKFKSMYEKAKLDYNDFESLAGLELSKAMSTFNPKKSNLFTYATTVITQKALTELRNCTQRDKRKALHVAESVDALDEQGNTTLNIVDKYLADSDTSKDVLSDKMTAYLNRLSNLQRRILFMMSEGYSNDEIRRFLDITAREMSDACAALKSYRNVSLLY